MALGLSMYLDRMNTLPCHLYLGLLPHVFLLPAVWIKGRSDKPRESLLVLLGHQYGESF
jgi:hypothetical protein